MFNIRELLNMNNKDKMVGRQAMPVGRGAAIGGMGKAQPGQRMQMLEQAQNLQPMQPIPGRAQVPYSQQTADRYNANPTSPEFSGKNAIDPKYFGYPADNAVRYEDGSNSNGRRAMDSPDDYLSQTLRRLLGY